jgi:hypothetical protein
MISQFMEKKAPNKEALGREYYTQVAFYLPGSYFLYCFAKVSKLDIIRH